MTTAAWSWVLRKKAWLTPPARPSAIMIWLLLVPQALFFNKWTLSKTYGAAKDEDTVGFFVNQAESALNNNL